jgi:hypothetical protein
MRLSSLAIPGRRVDRPVAQAIRIRRPAISISHLFLDAEFYES